MTGQSMVQEVAGVGVEVGRNVQSNKSNLGYKDKTLVLNEGPFGEGMYIIFPRGVINEVLRMEWGNVNNRKLSHVLEAGSQEVSAGSLLCEDHEGRPSHASPQASETLL